MGLTEREETTEYAVGKISKMLGDEDYTSAILLSHIYSTIRLRSIIADHLRGKETGEAWKRIQSFLKIPSFSQLFRYVEKQGLLTRDQTDALTELNIQRNHAAHESTIWRKPTSKDEEALEAASHYAATFLVETS